MNSYCRRIQLGEKLHSDQGTLALLRNEERVKSVSLEENRDSEFKEIYVMDKEKIKLEREENRLGE